MRGKERDEEWVCIYTVSSVPYRAVENELLTSEVRQSCPLPHRVERFSNSLLTVCMLDFRFDLLFFGWRHPSNTFLSIEKSREWDI